MTLPNKTTKNQRQKKNYAKKEIGNIGEKIAVKYLKDCGYKILEKNFRKRYGEIDIVTLKKNGFFSKNKELIFIEVKTKTKNKGYNPEENINFRKRKNLIKTAKYYILKNKYNINWRIDTIIIELDPITRKANLRHIKNAVY